VSTAKRKYIASHWYVTIRGRRLRRTWTPVALDGLSSFGRSNPRQKNPRGVRRAYPAQIWSHFYQIAVLGDGWVGTGKW